MDNATLCPDCRTPFLCRQGALVCALAARAARPSPLTLTLGSARADAPAPDGPASDTLDLTEEMLVPPQTDPRPAFPKPVAEAPGPARASGLPVAVADAPREVVVRPARFAGFGMMADGELLAVGGTPQEIGDAVARWAAALAEA